MSSMDLGKQTSFKCRYAAQIDVIYHETAFNQKNANPLNLTFSWEYTNRMLQSNLCRKPETEDRCQKCQYLHN